MAPTAEKIQDEELGRPIYAAAPGLQITARLFDRVVDIVFCIKDRSGRYIAANAAFARRLGRKSPRDLIGRTARELFPPALAAVYEAEDAEVLSTGRSVCDKLELVFNLDGSLGWYLAQKEPVVDAAGQVIGVVGISRDLRLSDDDAPRIAGIASAVACIRQRFREGLRIAQIARDSGLSIDAFERQFRRAMGLAPRDFLLSVRIDEAAHLLRTSDQTLAKIAADCGFYDQSSFTRLFRRAVGVTPSAFRRAVGGT